MMRAPSWRGFRVLLLLLFCWTTFFVLTPAKAEPAKSVFVIPVQNEIETGLAATLKHAFQEAKDSGAQVIVLDINTLGGRIDAAVEIADLIRSSNVPVIAYIRGHAISAGAYLAMNATHIAMAPGSTIGAAEVRNSDGEPVDPKVVAFWRSEMTAAAEFQGRDEKLAVGMVDRNTEIPGVKERGELVSLSAQQAVEHNLADGVFPTLQGALQNYGFGQASIQDFQPSVAEKIARFVTKPTVIPLLLILGLIGLGAELLLPGHFVPGLIGVACLGLYFFGSMVAGFAGWEAVILFVAGIILLVAEIFVVGFGILGTLGVLAVGTGVVMAAYDTTYGIKVMLVALALAAVVVAVLFKYFGHLGVWNRLIHTDVQEKAAGYTPNRNLRHMLYQVGRTVTPLRPAGTAVFNGQRFDVVSDGAFVPVGTDVQIVLIEGTRIVVKAKPKDGDANLVIPRLPEEQSDI
ncbi:nodulation protein NfeD [Tumebacillus sp. ITR2]|uniref:Nodulation protein NfeD n=1 Tax=Tumebacillus amylolyticus TaxID=2801339 RepID=A0ABS1JDJ6_9BACL|nr:nodulation protein NfeD [Tumebacillus amylolyticus]MBL0388357.1 nodulation protein NfeD [Tumebacillus amylolyticus]